MTENIKNLLLNIKEHGIFKDFDFRLIGGTALSHHLNHRLSEDLDFCIMGKLPRRAIAEFISRCVDLYNEDKVDFIEFSQGKLLDFQINCEDIMDYEQNWKIAGVKVTFFDGSDNRGVRDIFKNDCFVQEGNIKIASVDSIFAMKSLMFYNRAKSRDYFDLLCMYEHDKSRYSVEKTLALIQKYEMAYQGEDGMKLFLQKLEYPPYSKERDEPLVGLISYPEDFKTLSNRLVKLIKNADMDMVLQLKESLEFLKLESNAVGEIFCHGDSDDLDDKQREDAVREMADGDSGLKLG
ncbi:MAG: hypothetical protein QG567_2022 [Campylobacterota bacterium]|nr:hypothetical protein [Campylobacterota bacterium]